MCHDDTKLSIKVQYETAEGVEIVYSQSLPVWAYHCEYHFMNNRLTRYEFDYRDPKETIWQEKMKQRHVWSESLCRSHDADRETARGVLQVLRHTSWCSYDEGCNSLSRQHQLWL